MTSIRRPRPAHFALCAPLLAAALCGCPSGDDDDEPFPCEAGTLTEEGAFVPLLDGDRAELVLGFQGFLFVELRARADDPPRRTAASMRITVAGDPPAGSSQNEVDFVAAPGGGFVSDPVLVFLDGSAPEGYVGRTAEVAVALAGEGRRCVMERSVLLVDDDPCVHTDGEPVCPDPDPGDDDSAGGDDSAGDDSGAARG